MTADELRHKLSYGQTLTDAEMQEVIEAMDTMKNQIQRLTAEKQQLAAKVGVFQGMLDQTMATAASTRSIADIREEVMGEGTKRDTFMYNAFEVRQVLYYLDNRLEDHRYLKESYDNLYAQSTVAVGLTQTLADIDANVVRPFSFQDVSALVEVHRNAQTLSRPVRKNIREIFQLLKAQPNALFYGEEVLALRKWGTDHDRNLSVVKMRLGRAFTDPVGYMDNRFDLMLTKDTKRQLLDGRVLSAHAYQDAVFSRPDFLRIKADWCIGDEKTQFHAGEHWHTDSAGKWWCGSNFARLTAKELMIHLETALGELRLLYIHFPNGVTNETV